MSMRVEVTGVDACRNKVVFRLNYSKPLRKYFLKDTFFAEYDSELDISSVDKSILAIPIVSVIAPVAWAVGADIQVNRLDETYLHSLTKVKEVFRGFYPGFSFSSDMHVKNVVSSKFGGSRTGLLFSGGLDSITSYIRHNDERPDLISVWGSDFRLHEQESLNEVMAGIRWLANRDSVTALEVKTDLNYINARLLSYEFRVRCWYAEVAHGLMLLGLSAPITAVRAISSVLIASSLTEDFKEPYGSLPSIDNNVSWADVTVIHDGFELSRQQKIRYVCSASPQYLSHLRVCNYGAKTNCVKCEKCLRTIAGLTLAGMDPRDCNFNIDTKVFARIKDSLLKGKMPVGEAQKCQWTYIQRHIPDTIENDIYGSREFFTWFRQFDLLQPRTSRLRRLLWHVWLNLWRASQMMRNPEGIREKMQFIQWLAVCNLYVAFARMTRYASGIVKGPVNR